MMQPPGSVADDVAFRTAHPADTPFILADSAARSEFNRLTERLIDRNRGRRHRR
jgi:hypothetical protein